MTFTFGEDGYDTSTEMMPERVPLDRRHVFELTPADLQPLVASGTVKRVGLHHIWTRL